MIERLRFVARYAPSLESVEFNSRYFVGRLSDFFGWINCEPVGPFPASFELLSILNWIEAVRASIKDEDPRGEFCHVEYVKGRTYKEIRSSIRARAEGWDCPDGDEGIRRIIVRYCSARGIPLETRRPGRPKKPRAT